MAARLAPADRRGRADCRFLAGNAPAPRLPRARGVGKIEDHDDVADVAFDGRGKIGVAAVEVVAVHAAAGGAPLGDGPRPRRRGDVVNAQAAAEAFLAAVAVALVVDDHHAVLGTHLVRVPAGGDFDMRQQPRRARIGNVVDRGARGRAHVCDVEGVAVDPHLAAARAVDVRDDGDIASGGHIVTAGWESGVRSRSQSFRGTAIKRHAARYGAPTYT